MKKISLLSDTHSFLDEAILDYCSMTDEIWHAGDFGTIAVSDQLSVVKPLRGVYGNIDGDMIRKIHPKQLDFTIEGVSVRMIHIGGYPGKYSPVIKESLHISTPHILVSGHSHILKVMRDKTNANMLFINPGAAGKHGFHKIRTMVQFKIDDQRIFDFQVIELGSKTTPVT